MAWDVWLALAAASAVMVALPGPTVLLIVSHALSYGRRSAMATVAGVALGDLAAMSASLAGLGVLLATSAELFALLRWLGAAYLIYLGLRLWRAPVDMAGLPAADDPDARRVFLHAFAVTALNPKSIMFFVAFVPQFITADAAYAPQAAVAVATYVGLSIINASLFGMLGARARRVIRRPGLLRAVNRLGGGLMIGAGVMTAAWRRAAD